MLAKKRRKRNATFNNEIIKVVIFMEQKIKRHREKYFIARCPLHFNNYNSPELRINYMFPCSPQLLL